MEEKKEVKDIRKHFAKLHEKIQNKYDEMQKRLEKCKSVDALATIDDDYDYKEQRYSSNDNLREPDDFDRVEIDRNTLTRTVIVEEVTTRNARFQDVHREESICESIDDFMFIEREEIEHENEYNKRFNYSCESLNEYCGDSDSYSIPSTPPPRLSIRDRICSKLSARRERQKVIDREEIERNNENNKQCNYSQESLNEVDGDSDGCSVSIPSTPPPKISIRDRINSKITARRERRKAEKENALKDNKKKETREKVEKFILSNTTKQDFLKGFKKSKVATLTIALIEASGLETDVSAEKPRFMICRFRLGTEKYKSKLIKSHKPVVKWQELFNFHMYDENMLEITLWEKDVFIGRTIVDLLELEKEKTHRMRLDLECETGNAQVFILLTITGTALVNTLVDLDDYQETQRRLSVVRKKFAWYHIKNDAGDVGWCSIIVYGAKGLSGNECYCIVELGNDRLHTQTDSKTNDPNWMKIFTFTVKDITSILEVTVHDEKKSEDVGKVSIPLFHINNGEKKWYALKDSTQRDRAKGNNPRILLEMKVTWSHLRASIRAINPKEEKYLELDDKLQRYIFARNLSRAKAVFSWTMDAFRIVKTCFEWESKKSNVIALTTWLLFCWLFKMWMLPLLMLIPFVWYRPEKYYLIHWKKYFNKKVSMELEEASKKDKEEKNTSLRQKINSLQEMVQSVQNFIGKFASLGESIKNLFNFTVPFLSILAIIMITAVALFMYLVPVQYIFIIWGVHKFTRKILRPNRIPNNEILDILSRVPDDETLLNIQELPLEKIPEEDVIK